MSPCELNNNATHCRFIGLLAMFVIASSPLVADKRGVVADQYPNSRQFATSCDSLWPVAMRTFIKTGFVPQTSDKAGGVISLAWRKGQSGGFGANQDVRSLTNASRGALTTFERFGINSASAVFTSEEKGCRLEITMALVAWKNSLLQKGWVAVESNGSFENRMLEAIDSDLDTSTPAQAASGSSLDSARADAPKPKPPENRSAATHVEPKSEDSQRDTQIVSLPGQN